MEPNMQLHEVRGLDMLVGTYSLLDLVPKGRDKAALPWTMAWVRHHEPL